MFLYFHYMAVIICVIEPASKNYLEKKTIPEVNKRRSEIKRVGGEEAGVGRVSLWNSSNFSSFQENWKGAINQPRKNS